MSKKMKKTTLQQNICRDLTPTVSQSCPEYDPCIQEVVSYVRKKGASRLVFIHAEGGVDTTLFLTKLISHIGLSECVYVPCALVNSYLDVQNIINNSPQNHLIFLDCPEFLGESSTVNILETFLKQKGKKISRLIIMYYEESIYNKAEEILSRCTNRKVSPKKFLLRVANAHTSEEIGRFNSENTVLRELYKIKRISERSRYFLKEVIKIRDVVSFLLEGVDKGVGGASPEAAHDTDAGGIAKEKQLEPTSILGLCAMSQSDREALRQLLTDRDIIISTKYLMKYYMEYSLQHVKEVIKVFLSMLPAEAQECLIHYFIGLLHSEPTEQLVDIAESLIVDEDESVPFSQELRRKLKVAQLEGLWILYDMPEPVGEGVSREKNDNLPDLYRYLLLGRMYHQLGHHLNARSHFLSAFKLYLLQSTEENIATLITLLSYWAEAEATNGYLHIAEKLIVMAQLYAKGGIPAIVSNESTRKPTDFLSEAKRKKMKDMFSKEELQIISDLYGEEAAYKLQYVRGYLFFQQGYLGEAYQTYAQLLQLYRNKEKTTFVAHRLAEVYREMARVLLREGYKKRKKENIFIESIEDYSDISSEKLIKYYLDAAEECLKHIREGDRKRFRATLNLWRGELLLRERKYEEAIKLFTNSLDVWVQAKQPRWISWSLNKLAEAQLLFWHENVIKMTVYNEDQVKREIGEILARIKQSSSDQVKVNIEEILTVCWSVIGEKDGCLPHKAHTLLNWGWFLFHQGNYEAAIVKLYQSLAVRFNQESDGTEICKSITFEEAIEKIKSLVCCEVHDFPLIDAYALFITFMIMRMCIVKLKNKKGETFENLTTRMEKLKEALRSSRGYRAPKALSEASQRIRY